MNLTSSLEKYKAEPIWYNENLSGGLAPDRLKKYNSQPDRNLPCEIALWAFALRNFTGQVYLSGQSFYKIEFVF